MLLFSSIFLLNMNAQSAKFSKDHAKFKAAYLRELKDAGIVGSSFVFLKDNKILAREFYGSANLEKNQPVDENTIYHWASNTKPFTGEIILECTGSLKLYSYLPPSMNFPTVNNPAVLDHVKMRMLGRSQA